VTPELVWGLVPRLIGVLYIIAFGGLAPQLPAMIGSRGLGPIRPRLAAIRRDYPGLRRFFMFPTLLWLASSDRAVRIIPWLGIACGVVIVIGGPLAFWAQLAAFLLWLALEPAALIFPWDTMLQEVGFLALFLPRTELLPELEAASLPWPSVAFMFRWFVLRLMLGFGKLKFIGTKREDALYLRGFFVWAPSPTPLAWFGHHLPAWLLRAMLGFMFVAEVIAPLLGFFAGVPRLISYGLLCMLMVGIQATGNWGFFNVGYVFLLTGLLDVNGSLFDLGNEPWHSQLWTLPVLSMHVVLVLMFLTGLVYLVVFDSWTGRTVIHWPLDRFTWNRPWLRALIAYFRALAPFRIVNGYGVFPPSAIAPLRHGVRFEGSDDGVSWKAYSLKRMPTRAAERAQFVAPNQARIDMALCYTGGCVFDASFFGSLIGDGTPYTCYTRASWLERMCQRLLEAEPCLMRLMGDNPFPDAPPKWMRVSLYGMTPTHPQVRRATGDWWHTRRLGTIVPARTREEWPQELSLPQPEVFHPDWVDYKRSSATMRALAAALASGTEPDQAVLVESDLTADDVRRFWDELVPAATPGREEFAGFAERGRALTERFGRMQMARFERVLERFAWLLRLRTERQQYADAEPKIALESNFRYHMFLQELVLDGREAYLSVLQEPARAAARLERSTDSTQLWGLAVLRHELMVSHVLAFRWTTVGVDAYQLKVPGLFEYYPLLAAFAPEEEEFALDIVKHPSGEHTIKDFYPPPALPIASP
jgi:lipase maturation factor 1